jgi:hypothetical protein
LDQKVLDEFSQKLDFFLESFSGIARNYLEKLEKISSDSVELVRNTEFLREIKENNTEKYDILKRMQKAINELLNRLNKITQK